MVTPASVTLHLRSNSNLCALALDPMYFTHLFCENPNAACDHCCILYRLMILSVTSLLNCCLSFSDLVSCYVAFKLAVNTWWKSNVRLTCCGTERCLNSFRVFVRGVSGLSFCFCPESSPFLFALWKRFCASL